MKIHGTAKGGALSKKDFGVAFAVETAPSADYTSDFSATNWVEQDSGEIGVNTTTEKLDWAAKRDNTNDAASRDMLSENVSDTKWVLRMTWVVDTVTQGTSGSSLPLLFGVDSLTSTSNAAANHEFIGFQARVNNTIKNYYAQTANGATLDAVPSTVFSHTIAEETLYIEITRIDSENATVEFFSDDTFSESASIESVSLPVNSNTNGMRYIWFGNMQINPSGVDSVLDGTINKIEFWNDVNEV